MANLQITATRLPVGNQNTILGRSTPDESGRYLIDVPAGRYLVAIEADGRSYCSYSHAGMTDKGEPTDALLVDEEHPHTAVDFDLGVVRVRLTAPSELNDRQGRVTLHRRGDTRPPAASGPVNRGSGEFNGGTLEIVVPGVIPGMYKMAIDIGYWGERFWVPAARDSSRIGWCRTSAEALDAVARTRSCG